MIRRLCIRLSQATYSSAIELYEKYTYGELLEWAEDVRAAQAGPKKDEAVNIESELLKEY